MLSLPNLTEQQHNVIVGSFFKCFVPPESHSKPFLEPSRRGVGDHMSIKIKGIFRCEEE